MKKKITAGVLLILLLAGVCIQPAYANSAQRHWRGTDGTGAVVTGEDCPIVVDKELLTFDVQNSIIRIRTVSSPIPEKLRQNISSAIPPTMRSRPRWFSRSVIFHITENTSMTVQRVGRSMFPIP